MTGSSCSCQVAFDAAPWPLASALHNSFWLAPQTAPIVSMGITEKAGADSLAVPPTTSRSRSMEAVRPRSGQLWMWMACLVSAAAMASCQPGGAPAVSRICQADGICLNPDGTKVYADGSVVPCDKGGNCPSLIGPDGISTADTSDTLTHGTSSTGNTDIVNPEPRHGDCRPADPSLIDPNDKDGDCIPDALECAHDTTGAINQDTTNDPTKCWTNPTLFDTDGDGLGDGFEDWNHDGVYTPLMETNPRAYDTDGDGLCDGFGGTDSHCADNFGEDHNNNGVVDYGETNPSLVDTDGDGIADGLEDANHNGIVDAWVDTNHNGCFDPGIDTPGETSPVHIDTDADGIIDGLEDRNHNGVYEPALGETAAFLADTDCDGLPDGKEDLNRNGYVDMGETDPRLRDSDGDGLFDGYNPTNPYDPGNGGEDVNNNGHVDPGETSPILVDSDGDGIADGIEDRNHNGKVDAWVDSNHNGCFDQGEQQGESDPRKYDTDGDGISDGFEDQNHDGLCDTAFYPDPLSPNPSALKRNFVETCAFLTDTDCDGLTDGIEDKNHNGSRDVGETDPRQQDSDFDGLMDGCPAIGATANCEDKNNNGVVDAGETSPILADTDGDGLSDSCEYNFGPHPPTGGTDPLNEDTDGDGNPDGDEDANHNCVVDAGETDPRVFDAPPAASDPNYAKYSVCGTENLNSISYAQSARAGFDMRVAFEVERAQTGACSAGCPASQQCIDGQCVLQSYYSVAAFGRNLDGQSFSENDPNDTLMGWVFQSPAGIVRDSATNALLNRDIYGFVLVEEDTRGLDDILDGVRAQLQARYTQASISEVGNLPSRPSFDTLPHDRTYFAQRQISLNFFAAGNSALSLRNDILVNGFLSGTQPDPSTVPPTTDPVYGSFSCPSSAYCYANYTLYIGAVQRLDQVGPTGKPVIITVVSLTPNNSDSTKPTLAANRFYADRLTRLNDLTGGSSVAHFAATTGKACDARDPNQAKADLLWVVDDSRSMQQIISRIQQAALAAQSVLTSNSGIVDFRVGMTTTNPSANARTQCQAYCNPSAMGQNADGTYRASDCDSTCVDQTLGCIKVCNASCSSRACTAGKCTCGNGSGVACSGTANPEVDCNAGTCIDTSNPTLMAQLINLDGQNTNNVLPGGGGTFYYEDTQFLDCDSSNPPSGTAANLPYAQIPFLNLCSSVGPSSSPYYTGNIPSFFGSSMTRKQLRGNAGMMGSDPNATSKTSCAMTNMDLRFSTVAPANTACTANSCCQRLTNVCDDGPTVLASQMCDLIRAMGGLPGTSVGAPTSGARRHSAPEHGSRSARRLLQSMLPALPADYAQHPDSNNYDATKHLRRICNTSATCTACNPTTDANCIIVPLATVFLSDEEDFFFKDDCTSAQQDADKRQLPESCYYVDGDPTTAESCLAPAGSATNPTGTTPLAYCQAYSKSGIPTGYNPDQAAWTPDPSYTLQWRQAAAAECTGQGACVMDACEYHPDTNSCSADSSCVWSSNTSICINRHCANYTSTQPPTTRTLANAEKANCQADSQCRWDQSQLQPYVSQHGACLPAIPPNDCAACKRLLRSQAALVGEPNLIGFGDTGPVYAVVRNKGAPGQGGVFVDDAQDSCGGGTITWGRGDGQGYRDLAINTLGRTQDVCATSYQNFVALLVADLAVLSKPYPLSGDPIASTLKVGIKRPNGSGGFSYIPVPRSSTSGFIYDATGNSIGFKSDPVDGQCGTLAGGCSANGVIEQTETLYARTAPFVPQTGDIIYISYRLWEPIPCLGACLSNEMAASTSRPATPVRATTAPQGYVKPSTTAACATPPARRDARRARSTHVQSATRVTKVAPVRAHPAAQAGSLGKMALSPAARPPWLAAMALQQRPPAPPPARRTARRLATPQAATTIQIASGRALGPLGPRAPTGTPRAAQAIRRPSATQILKARATRFIARPKAAHAIVRQAMSAIRPHPQPPQTAPATTTAAKAASGKALKVFTRAVFERYKVRASY
ncbi:hypothetical protein Q3G72_030806 [Acer saccharum]|nr:hypothetical protein Q3G72_030806 [Acer saccharum]